MPEIRRVDESLSANEMIKALTGRGNASLDLSNVVISSTGEMQPAPEPPPSTQPVSNDQQTFGGDVSQGTQGRHFTGGDIVGSS